MSTNRHTMLRKSNKGNHRFFTLRTINSQHLSPLCSLFSMCSLLLWEMSTTVREPVFLWLVLMRSHPDQLNKFWIVFFFSFGDDSRVECSLRVSRRARASGQTILCKCTIRSVNNRRVHDWTCDALHWRNKTRPDFCLAAELGLCYDLTRSGNDAGWS